MKLYLDDQRPLPNDYDILVREAKNAIELLKTGLITEISLDHDLGKDSSGYEVALFIEEQAMKGNLKEFKCFCHSQNPVGKDRIEKALEKAEYYWKVG